MKKISTSSPLFHTVEKLPLCNDTCRRNAIYVLWLFIALLPFHQYYIYKFEFTQWDLLLFTGLLSFILGLHLVASVQERFHQTIERLRARGTVKINDEAYNFFIDQLEKNAEKWARLGGVISAIAILAAFSVALYIDFKWDRTLLGIAEAFGAYIAGTYLGRMACYGQLGWKIEKESVAIEVQPSHVDGVGGLKPIGDFFFYQAMITAIPAIFLAVWWFLFPIWPRDYSHWQDPYLALISVAILIEILSFILPIWSFHRIMLCKKSKLLEEADKLSLEINELIRKNDLAKDSNTKELLSEQIEDKSKRYWDIENMSVWPVDIKTKRQFKVNNILLFVPLLGDIAKRTVELKDIINFLKGLT